MRVTRWRRSAAKAKLAALTIATAGVLFGAPAARATDGGEHAYLPEKADWCLRASQPKIEGADTTQAFVSFEYGDTCTFPAFSSVEIRGASGGWSEVGKEPTRPTEGKDKSVWTKRGLRLSGLRRGTRYLVRTRIDYLFHQAHTNELAFTTGGNRSRDMQAWGILAAFPPKRR
jgi:hypothetical protein